MIDKINTILRWFFAIFFGMMGISMIKSGIPSILVLISALLLLPFSEKLINKKIKIPRIRYIPMVVILLAVSVFSLIGKNSGKKGNINEEVAVNYIPGMKEYDLAGILIDKNYKCKFTPGESQNKHGCILKASGYQVTVDIFGKSSKIKTVDAIVQNFGGSRTSKLAKNHLGFISSIPYEGSTPKEARGWVESNINKKRTEKIFRKVKFSIYGKGRSKWLRISAIQPETK